MIFVGAQRINMHNIRKLKHKQYMHDFFFFGGGRGVIWGVHR